MKRSPLTLSVAAASLCVSQAYSAGINSTADEAQLSNVTVSSMAQVGNEVSASMGTVVAEQIEQRPISHFGKFALNEDNSEKADAVTLLNAQANYQLTAALQLSLELLNITDEEGNDITYLYESRLPGEAVPAGQEGIEDVHFHPVEPRMVRASMTYEF